MGTNVLAWYIGPNGTGRKETILNYPYPIDIKKYEILIMDTWMVLKRDNTMTTIAYTTYLSSS